MEAYRTEDEQVEALKQWWKKNGTLTLLGAVLVFAAYFGWQAWQNRQLQQAEAASTRYQQLLLLNLQLQQEPTDSRYATASHLVAELMDTYSTTVYAQYAALIQARLLVQQNDLDGAEADLRWVLDAAPDDPTRQLTSLRLARILFSQGDVEAALAVIDGVDPGKFAAAYHELRGDIAQRARDPEAARKNYLQALSSSAGNMPANPLVQMKLQSLPVAPAEVEAEAIVSGTQEG